MKRFCAVALFISMLSSSTAFGEIYLRDPVTDLNAAMSAYNNGEYAKAFDEFSAMSARFPDDSHNSIFHFMAAKSLYMKGDYRRADSLWTDFINVFHGSTLIQEALLFKGHCLYKQKKLVEAADSYLLSIDINPKSKTSGIARDNLNPLVNRGLTIGQLKSLIEDHPTSSATEPLEYMIAKREIDLGHYRKGVIALQAFVRRYPGSHNFKQARLLLEESKKKTEGQVSIGLLAPVSGSYKEFGRSMIEGARLAMKSLKSDSLDIEINIKDTGSDPIQAAKITKDMADEEPLAMVGPLNSESALSAAIVLNERGIPMITPTASENGLASIGPYIFQISPPAELIGAALGQFAVRNLSMNEFAIISPDDADGIKISNAFAEAVYRLGGEVISTTYYPTGSTDFKAQIMPLHEILVARAEAQLAAGHLDSSAFLDPKTHKLLAKDNWPVNLDGLFLPGYADELKMLIPQVRYHVIRTRFLGTDNWDSEKLIREVKPYVENAVYAADFHVSPGETHWTNFSDSYQDAYGHAPDKVAATTYDAVKMILNGIEAGNKDPGKLRDYLSQIQDYSGVSSTITFKGTGRANNVVGIYSTDGKRLLLSK